MGLIKAAASALSGTMDDVWKELFVCDSLPMEVLMVRGVKRVSARSANTGGDPNTITDGSVILVADGQCAVVVSGGKVIDSCSEPGEYTFRDPKHVPGLGGLLKETGERIAFGGDALPRLHRVYYINMKESMNNAFQSSFPAALLSAGGHGLSGTLTFSGLYSYRIKDPALFYKLLAGNVAGSYTRGDLTGQITAELQTSLGPTISRLGAWGVRPSVLPGYAEALSKALREAAAEGWIGQHGLEIVSLGVSVFSPSSGDMAEARRLSRAATLFGMPPEEKGDAAPGAWLCQICGAESTGAFCPQCGRSREWTCGCGKVNRGRFCMDCGKERP